MKPVVAKVAAHFGIPEAELLGPSQYRSVSYPRHIAMYLLRALCTECGQGRGMGAAEIGKVLNRSRSAVDYAVRRIAAELRAGNVETIYDVSDLEMGMDKEA